MNDQLSSLKSVETSIDISLIERKILEYQDQGKSLFATSSFQSHSLPLLHILSRIDNTIPVYFTNTGFLFPKTLMFAEQLASDLGLYIIGLRSATPKVHQKDHEGRFYFTSDPDHCCYLNKIQPLEPILMKHDVWINGIRADQSAHRKTMREEEPAPYNTMRYHPMLSWDARMIHHYVQEYDLPPHPMESDGYLSIGCEPCTSKFLSEGNERNARWFGMNKTECGLHTQLIKK
jgi:phosphoadenosine phosphosulfate reductase